MQTDAIRVCHLGRVGHDLGARSGPDHHRSHHEPRARGVVVQQTQDGRLVETQPELFVGFAQSGLHRRLVTIDLSSGKCPLAGVTVHARGTATQEERRASGHSAHTSVQTGDVAGHPAHRVVTHGEGIGMVVGFTVDEHDGHRGATKTVGGLLQAAMPIDVATNRLAQSVVVGNHRDFRSVVAPTTMAARAVEMGTEATNPMEPTSERTTSTATTSLPTMDPVD